MPATELAGFHVETSLDNDKTAILWKRFMSRRDRLIQPVSDTLWSVSIYPSDYFRGFDPQRSYIKWAALKIHDREAQAAEFDILDIPEGYYAIFNYHGPSGNPEVFQYIFRDWLPNSPYLLDHRPHFERLGRGFFLNSPDSEEEIWISVRPHPD